METQQLIPADKGKRLLQQLLKRSIPKNTLQRWRKAASVKLEIINGTYFYKKADLLMIYRLAENLADLPIAEKTYENAYFNAYQELEGDN